MGLHDLYNFITSNGETAIGYRVVEPAWTYETATRERTRQISLEETDWDVVDKMTGLMIRLEPRPVVAIKRKSQNTWQEFLTAALVIAALLGIVAFAIIDSDNYAAKQHHIHMQNCLTYNAGAQRHNDLTREIAKIAKVDLPLYPIKDCAKL